MLTRSYTSNITDSSITDTRNYFILFILWPFLSFMVALANFSRKEARTVVYIFLIYYGLSFVNANVAVDAYRYALSLKANSLLPFSDFFKIVGGLYSDTTVDIIEPLISFIVSRFTSDHGLYFGVWAAIFGYFYLKSITLIYDRYIVEQNMNTILLMAFFVMTIPVTMISGVRMWTAAWIFFYGAFRVITEKNPRFLFISFSAVFVHWSFISANAILLIYYLIGNRNIIYIPLAVSSFVLPHIMAPVFRVLALRLGGGMQQRYAGYSSEGYMLAVQEGAAQSAWFMRITNDMVFYYLLIAIAVIQLRHSSMMKEKHEQNLFSFLLLFLAFVNFGMPIPSFGERFMILFFLFATAYIIMYFSKLSGNKIYFLILLGLFPLLLYSMINLRLGFENINAWIFSPGFGVPLFAPVLSLYEVLFY
ncbi:MAG: EpsG family protein [Bacteroidales bacterium]|jgi:hypothetical protein|nr:hypothetical protein [Bacteroidales bacterium]